jgi:hypothetical protein
MDPQSSQINLWDRLAAWLRDARDTLALKFRHARATTELLLEVLRFMIMPRTIDPGTARRHPPPDHVLEREHQQRPDWAPPLQWPPATSGAAEPAQRRFSTGRPAAGRPPARHERATAPPGRRLGKRPRDRHRTLDGLLAVIALIQIIVFNLLRRPRGRKGRSRSQG